eukprot:sb/3473788/
MAYNRPELELILVLGNRIPKSKAEAFLIGFGFRKLYIETTDNPFQWEKYRNCTCGAMGWSINRSQYLITYLSVEKRRQNFRAPTLKKSKVGAWSTALPISQKVRGAIPRNLRGAMAPPAPPSPTCVIHLISKRCATYVVEFCGSAR